MIQISWNPNKSDRDMPKKILSLHLRSYEDDWTRLSYHEISRTTGSKQFEFHLWPWRYKVCFLVLTHNNALEALIEGKKIKEQNI